MKKITIVGLDHHLQWKDTEAGHLRSAISDVLARDSTVGLIAEEANALPTTVGMRVAFHFNKPWANVEMDRSERWSRGLPARIIRRSAPLDDGSDGGKQYYSQDFDPIREDFWLSQIKGYGIDRVLFICGLLHLDTVAAKFSTDGWDVEEINVCSEPWYVERFGTFTVVEENGERWCETRPPARFSWSASSL
jgi:hypothetical protein